MKKIFMAVVLAGGLTACNESGNTINVETDSLRQELDTLGEKIEDKAGQVWDSTKSKAENLKNEIEARFDSAKKE